MAAEQAYLNTLVEQIKAEKDPNQSINKLADVVLAMDDEGHNRHKALDKKIDKLSVAILGNGSPENALLTRVCRLERWQKWLFGGLAFIGTTTSGWLIVEILTVIK